MDKLLNHTCIQMKYVFSTVVLMLGFLLSIPLQADDCIPDKVEESIIVSGYYQFYFPNWWRSVNVTLPAHLDKMNNKDRLDFFRSQYPIKTLSDNKFWKEELKFRVLADTDESANFIAHLFALGGDHCTAVQVYRDLFVLVDSKKSEKDDVVFSRIYLSFKIIEQYVLLENHTKARLWIGIANKKWDALPVDKRSGAIKYYFDRIMEFERLLPNIEENY